MIPKLKIFVQKTSQALFLSKLTQLKHITNWEYEAESPAAEGYGSLGRTCNFSEKIAILPPFGLSFANF